MIPINPGHILPCYDERRWQPHRWRGGDVYPSAPLAPRTRLIPFQAWFAGPEPSVKVFQLVDPSNDGNVIELTNDINIDVKGDGSGFWATWFANETLSTIPDCGYWYPRWTFDGTEYNFHPLQLADLCGFEDALLEIAAEGCAEAAGTLTIPLAVTIYAGPRSVFVVERYNIGWSVIASNDTSFTQDEATALEEADYRIVMTSECGTILTVTYHVTWDSADACNTLAIAETSRSRNTANAGTFPAWRINANNGTSDKANVLYQTGYVQYYYVASPVIDTHLIDREVQKTVDGYGNETRRFTRTVARYAIEFADVPDCAIPFLSKLGDMQNVLFEDAELGDAFEMEDCEFEVRRVGAFQNIGRITFTAEIEAFSQCQQNFELT